MWLVYPILDSTVVGVLNARKLRSLKVTNESCKLSKDTLMKNCSEMLIMRGRKEKRQIKWSKVEIATF